jgi:dTDP-4-amino-4,6-dideoxygalactose transaminase
MNIPITKPVFGPEEFQAIQKPLETGWVVQGPYVKEFERRFCAFTGAAHSSAASSCTTALHLALAALKVQPGDEVIVPAFTWVATANVVEYQGARPIFCDVDLSTFNLDVRQLDSLKTPRTVGVLPVHLFGLCADMPAVLAFAQRHGLWVVEDAACAFGASYRGQHAGTFGEMGCFSFHPRKSITTGEGGMVTTASAKLDGLVRSLRDHGASRSDLARHHGKAAFLLAEYNHLGYNYRMTDFQGALGCAQMDRAPAILAARSAAAALYHELLGGLEWLQPPVIPEGHQHGWQAYVCLFRPEEPGLHNADRLFEWRNCIMTRLEEQGISTRQGTHAPVTCGYYAAKYGLRPEQFPQAALAEQLTLALPLYPQITADEQALVVTRLREAFGSLPGPGTD